MSATHLRTHRPEALRRLLDAGFLHYPAPSRLALTPRGLLLADSLLAELV